MREIKDDDWLYCEDKGIAKYDYHFCCDECYHEWHEENDDYVWDEKEECYLIPEENEC